MSEVLVTLSIGQQVFLPGHRGASLGPKTADGSDTALSDGLMRKAVEPIVAAFRKRVATGLQTGRGFKIPDQKGQANDTTGFELVTWLVIKKL